MHLNKEESIPRVHGYQVDAEGLHATEGKVKAILDAPKPHNVKELRSFLAL